MADGAQSSNGDIAIDHCVLSDGVEKNLSAMSHVRERRASVKGLRVKVASVKGHDARRVMARLVLRIELRSILCDYDSRL